MVVRAGSNVLPLVVSAHENFDRAHSLGDCSTAERAPDLAIVDSGQVGGSFWHAYNDPSSCTSVAEMPSQMDDLIPVGSEGDTGPELQAAGSTALIDLIE